MADDYNLIHDGFEEDLKEINKMVKGSDEWLRAWKGLEIRYGLDLKEYDYAFKFEDMAERRAFEKERLDFEKEKLEFEKAKAEQEAEYREQEAKAEVKKQRWQNGLAALGLGGSVIFAALGFLRDKPDSDMIRNNGQERDRDRIFNFGDKLRLR